MRVLMLPLAAMESMAAGNTADEPWLQDKPGCEGEKCEEGQGNCANDDQCKGDLICGTKNCLDWDDARRGVEVAELLDYNSEDNCCEKKPDRCAAGEIENVSEKACTCTSTSSDTVYDLCKKGRVCYRDQAIKEDLCGHPTCKSGRTSGTKEPPCVCKSGAGTHHTCLPGYLCHPAGGDKDRDVCVPPPCPTKKGEAAPADCTCVRETGPGVRDTTDTCSIGETCNSESNTSANPVKYMCSPKACPLTGRNPGTCSCMFHLVHRDLTKEVVCLNGKACVESIDGTKMPQCIEKIDYETRNIKSNRQETPHRDLPSCKRQCDDMFALAHRLDVLYQNCLHAPNKDHTTRRDITSCYRHCGNEYGDSSFRSLSVKEQEYQIECFEIKRKLVDAFECDETTDLCVKPVTPSPPTPPESGSKGTVTLLAIGGVVLGGGLIFFLVYMNRNLFFKKKHR